MVVQPVPAVQAPQTPEPLQTMFVPQLVPADLLPASMHVIAPVVQDVVPFLQAAPGFVVQLLPAVHVPHAPEPLQTMFVPQAVPAALLLPSTHVIAPVVQDVVPFRQAAFGFVVHVLPAVHAPQTPEPLQTMFVPQLVPAALLVPLMQVIEPVVQDVVPFLQTVGLVVHAVPAVHAPHIPTLQTRFVPHVVPFATFPVSAQTGTPVTHEVAPVLQWFVGWQAAALVHAPHVPLLQTMFVPQDAPLARFRPVSEHVIVGAQVCVPAWHGFAGVQASPAVHDAQAPELHTMFVPHDVPLATFPVSVQTGAPEVHTVAAVRQGLPVTTQLAPTVQSVARAGRAADLVGSAGGSRRDDWCSCPCRPAIPSRRRACPHGRDSSARRQRPPDTPRTVRPGRPSRSRTRFHSPRRRSRCKRARPSCTRSRRSGTGSSCVQAPPATQAAHAPLLHTMFVPQAMPFACAVPVSMHSTPLRARGLSDVTRVGGHAGAPPAARARAAGAR